MKKILREPLVHFLLLGAALFIAYNLLYDPGSEAPEEIVVTAGQVEHMAMVFTKTWQRPPTPEELAGLVRDRVREEVYCREAIALGLDKDDTVIRRRLQQKMEFVSNDLVAQVEPTDTDLEEYLQSNPEPFRLEQRFTFQQVFLDPERRGENLARDAEQLLRRLDESGADIDVSTLGDPIMLEHDFTAVPANDVAGRFGEEFAAMLGALAPGQWQGPIVSGYGVHLVLVSERTEGRLPALAEVRDAVRREWDNDRRAAANDAFYNELLKRYTVTIEGLEQTPQTKNLAKRETP